MTVKERLSINHCYTITRSPTLWCWTKPTVLKNGCRFAFWALILETRLPKLKLIHFYVVILLQISSVIETCRFNRPFSAKEYRFLVSSISGQLPAGDANWTVLVSFCLIGCPLLVIAIVSNSCAFLVFCKKPIFRKSISNRWAHILLTLATLALKIVRRGL